MADPAAPDPALLECGPVHWFADWPNAGVPKTGSIVYLVWARDGDFLHAGLFGRSEAAKGGRPSRWRPHYRR